jgi:phage-related minor tail protein
VAKRIQGITIQLDGETKGLDKALKDVNKRSIELQGELRDVDRLLKFSPDNIEAVAQKQKLLTEQVENTTTKLGQLKDAQKQVEYQFNKGEIGEQQYRSFRRELQFTETELDNLKKKLATVDDSIDSKQAVRKVDNIGEAFKRAGKKAMDFAKDSQEAVAVGGTGIAAAAGGLVTGNQDYNEILARLRTNAEIKSADFALVEEAFRKTVQITGETDAAGETISNLLASGISDKELLNYVDEVNGAYIRFSDTLKTEGIADGIQETLATGKAIGPFAELLERSGVNLETFDKGLEQAKKQGQGTQYVLDALAKQGFGQITEKYKELNPEVTKNAEANANLEKAMADLAIVLTPLVETVTSFITKAIEWAEANPTLTQTIVAVTSALGAIAGILLVLAPIFTALGAISTATGIAMLPLAGIIAGVIAVIAGLVAIGVYMYKNWDTISKNFQTSIKDLSTIGKSYMEMFKKNVAIIWDFIKGTFKNTLSFLKSLVTGDFQGMKDAISNQLDLIENTVSKIWNNVMSFLKGIKLKGVGKDIMQGLLDGIINKAEALYNKAAEIASKIKKTIKKALDINSPSRVMRDEVGKWIPAGIADGIEGNLGVIGKSVNRMSAAMKPDMPELNGGGLSAPQSITHSPSITIQNMSVRDDSDIKKIARELHNLTKMSGRRVGTV